MLKPILAVLLILLPSIAHAFINDADIAAFQGRLLAAPLGERIAFWAERFIGTPYDPDPLGEYVTKEAIVADERVDCMYLAFRTVELAAASTPGEAIGIALEKRFLTKGVLKDGRVVNYDERFQYAEDMLKSGRWGEDVTASLGETIKVTGSRGTESVEIIPKERIAAAAPNMQGGDIVYFVKFPEKRVVGEIVGHIGIVIGGAGKRGDAPVYIVHASGKKGVGGEVKKVLLTDYAGLMSFAGIIVGRF